LRRQVEYLAARGIVWSLEALPLPVSERLACFYGRLLDAAVPRLRRTAYLNLRMALPHADHRRIADGVFRSVGRLLLAVARFPQIDKRNVHEWIEYEGFEHFAAAKERGKGVLFATAHMGNWELSAFAHALMAEPMHIVVRPLDNPKVNGLLERRRTLAGNRIIEKKDAARSIVRALHQNEAVGILVDQNANLSEGVFIDFFGRTACAGVAFARIANRTGAAVIPGFALWCEKRHKYVLKFFPPVEMSGDDQVDTQDIHRILESIVREHPDQWLWIHRRWKTRPPGDASFYS
jgi:Kdo2-lipid IVA lauroyltransferase/acyltransferase